MEALNRLMECSGNESVIRGADAVSAQYVKKEISFLRGMMSGNKCVRISAALKTFKAIDASAFELIVRDLYKKENEDARKIFIYYIVLFRGETHLRRLMNKSDVPLVFIEDVVLYPLLHAGQFGRGLDKAFDELLDILPKQTVYALAAQSQKLSKNRTFIFYFLSKMDKKYIDKYFEDPEKVRGFISGVCSMPEELLRSFLLRNSMLHEYYVFFLHSIDVSKIPNAEKIRNIDFSEVEHIKRITEKVSERFVLDAELSLPLSKRNKKRFEFIVSGIRPLADRSAALARLESDGIIDAADKKLLEEIFENPFFGNVLSKYSGSADLFNKMEIEFLQ